MMKDRKMDWHLFWTAAGVVVTLAVIIIGCCVSLKSELNDLRNDMSTIKTVRKFSAFSD